MGYAVVHMQKVKSGGVGGLQSHNNREHPPRTNPDVDLSRSNENYSIVPCKNFARAIKTAVNNNAPKTKTVRKDAVVYCSFIVTSDEQTMKAMSEEQRKSFFSDTVAWFSDRYGAANVINATVHMDETTPHMHLGVVPITADRLSAKTLFDRKELTAIQTDFAKQVGERYGLKRGKEGSERTHLSETRYKQQQAEAKIQALQAQIEPLQQLKANIDDIDINVKMGLLGTVAVKKTDLEQILTYAKAYVANADDLQNMRERSNALDQKEKNISAKSARLDWLLNEQEELNTFYQQEKKKNSAGQLVLGKKNDQITTLQLENEDLRELMQSNELNFKMANRALYDRLSDVINALSGYIHSGEESNTLDSQDKNILESVMNYIQRSPGMENHTQQDRFQTENELSATETRSVKKILNEQQRITSKKGKSHSRNDYDFER